MAQPDELRTKIASSFIAQAIFVSCYPYYLQLTPVFMFIFIQ